MARTLIQIDRAITALLEQIRQGQANREISRAQLAILHNRAQKLKAIEAKKE